MTTIAAITLDGAVIMGGDSQVTIGGTPLPFVRKVARVPVGAPGTFQETALLGVSGPGALGQRIVHDFRLPSPDGDDHDRWAWAAARRLSELAANELPGVPDATDFHVLIGFRGQLWSATNGVSARWPDGIAAAGSGADYALGALHATAGLDAEAVRGALHIACHLDLYSATPVYLERIGRADT